MFKIFNLFDSFYGNADAVQHIFHLGMHLYPPNKDLYKQKLILADFLIVLSKITKSYMSKTTSH